MANQFTSTTPTRFNSTQLKYSVRLTNNVWSVNSSVTSQC